MNSTVGMNSLATENTLLAMARKKKMLIPSEETFGQRPARLRKARGLSQTKLGEMNGVSQRVMTYYDCQSERPPAHLLATLADALGVSVDELLGVRPVRETPVPRNTRLWGKLREIEKLPPGDRKAVLKILDGLLARQKLAGGVR